MQETPFSFSNLEAPVSGSTVAPGWNTLRGWVWPKRGWHFVDVRARVGERVFSGIHGRPRMDLTAHFRTPRIALAEFSVPVQLPLGSVTITLEVLDLAGQWSPFHVVTLTATGAPNQPPPLIAPQPLRWHDFSRGLDFILRSRRARPEASWNGLSAELAGALPSVQDRLFPPQPFIGHADEPAVVNSSRFGRLPVVGYLFHNTLELQRLWVTADLHSLQPLKLGRATDNLIPHFPQYPFVGVSGYEGYVDVPAQLPNPVVLRFYAGLPDGSMHLVQVRTTWRYDAELEKYPYAQVSVTDFTEATDAWRNALHAHGFAVEDDAQLNEAVARLRADCLRNVSTAPQPVHTIRPARSDTTGAPRQITLVSHNFNLEGAPLFLLDLARHFASVGASLTVVSACDGPLRQRFAATGARILILDPGAVFSARSDTDVRMALERLRGIFDFSAADVVITNTFTTFWAVHAAKAAGAPVLSYVHESTSLAAFYRDSISPAVLSLAEQALIVADAVTFTSEATKNYHAGPDRAMRAVITPGWVDVQQIDTWRQANPRDKLRACFRLCPDELLVTNVGTVCDRKGQIAFVRAVDLFQQHHPDLAARTRFVLLGGRDSAFDDMLRAVIANLGVPRLEVHAESPDYLAYYVAADLTACSSFEESSPRVVLEAMACGTPLLASDIAGIRELARHEGEATLVPPGDTNAWAQALAHMLQSLEHGRALATAARLRVEAEFAAAHLLPRHTALARAVAEGKFAP